MSQPATTAAPPLTIRTKLWFGVGSMAETIAMFSVSTFGLLFYNQIMGVPAHLAGMAVAAGLVLDGITEPLIGSLSDRTRSKWGRRHPWMFAAPLPIALSLFAIFAPPPGLNQTGLLIWFAVSTAMLRQVMTFFHTPHLALGGELSDDYTERSRVMSYNVFFQWVGGSLAWIVALTVFFRGSAEFPNGLLNPEPWPAFAGTMSVIALLILFGSAWFTRDRIPWLPKPADDTPRFSLREFFGDIAKAMTNRNYIWLLLGLLFVSLMGGVREGLTLYTGSFYWKLTSGELAWFAIGSLIGYLSSFLLAARLHMRFDKRSTMLAAVLIYSLAPGMAFALGLAGILTPDTPGLPAILIALSVFSYLPLSVMTITVWSALADVADENELKHGIRQEGVLYSTRAFFQRVDQAAGAALAGFVLTAIAFPTRARPDDVPQSVLDQLAMAYILAAIPGIIGAVCYGRYAITRGRYDQTRAALTERKAPLPEPPVEPAIID